jgi:ribosomal-protein-alanine N-acetyltransferase
MRYIVERMTMADIPRIVEIERLAYAAPWPQSAYRKELQDNQYAHYIVARDTASHTPIEPPRSASSRRFPLSFWQSRSSVPPEGDHGLIVGFAGLWLMMDEAHITTIADHPEYRGRGIGELMLNTLVGIAYEIGARRVTLECRVSNTLAQNLYHKYGFVVEGRRRRYYSDNHEDAFVMGTPLIISADYREHFAELRQKLLARLAADERAANAASPASGASGGPLPPAR